MYNTHNRFTISGKNVYVSLQDVCFTFQFIYIWALKIIIDIESVQIKCISRLFAKNLNDFNIHSFEQPVYYSVRSVFERAIRFFA